MIQNIKLKNFQSHKKTKIEFTSGVNCIIGDSDIGKSSVIRAISVLCRNEPSGNTFIRDGHKSCEITAFIDDFEVVRIKGTDNVYKLNETEFRSFRNEVPEEVSKVINLSEINFQNQHDAPFWFTLTAGEVSKQLNKLVDLDIIDTTTYNLNSDLRKTNTEISFIEKRIIENKEKAKLLLPYKRLNKKLIELESLEKKTIEKGKDRKQLNILIKNIKEYSDIIEENNTYICKGKGIVELGKIISEKEKTIERLSCMISIIEKHSKSIKKLPKINIQYIEDIKGKFDNKEIKYNSLHSLSQKIIDKKQQLKDIEKDINEIHEELKEFGDICPVCKQQIN